MTEAIETAGWSNAWPAPAKINLMLRILDRRPDGYHNLQTVFQFIQQQDILDFRVRTDGKIHRMPALPGVAEADDLTVRAAMLLQAATGTRLGADIRLDKRLPMGAGLGGGSSDAATVLVALNYLWKSGLSRAELAALGVQLGADVPVFVQGKAAWAEGIGERLQPIDLPEPYYLVLIPDCQVETAKIFANQQLTRDASAITICDFITGCQENHCLPTVKDLYLPVAAAYRWLQQVAEARLTGTGACVFAEFSEVMDAQRMLAQIPTTCRGFVTQGVNQSPLYERVAKEPIQA